MAVPFIDLKRFEPDFLDRWYDRVREVTENTQFVGGPQVAALEATLADACEAPAVVGCANGTDALQLALRAVGVGPGDTVLLPDATFWATFEAVVNCGARPVTVDIDRDDLQMDFDVFCHAVEREQPAAAILVHLYGWGSARLDDFRRFCRARDLPLVEDGAQAYGVRWHDASIYRDAHVSTISFYPAKVLGACGDAGAVVCGHGSDDPDGLAIRVRQLGNHGRTAHYGHGLVGWNSRMAGFDAAWLRLSLEYAPRRLDQRRALAARYRDRLEALGVRCVAPPAGYEENGYLSVTLHHPLQRPTLEAALKAAGIGYGTVYPGAMSAQPGAEGVLGAHYGGDAHGGAGDGDGGAWLGKSVLNLPLFAGMTEAEQDAVIDVVADAQRSMGLADAPADGSL
ncbi:MAG: aminotransferase class I/II-fold pyridoxal phosphate-dependent enzyme [Acidobacteriota bacterium]